MRLQKVTNRNLGIVPLAPWPIWEEILGHIFDNGIEHDQVTALGYQGRIEFQFPEHVGMRVLRVQRYQNRFLASGEVIDLLITSSSVEEP